MLLGTFASQKPPPNRTPYTPNCIRANPRSSPEYFWRRHRILLETPPGTFKNVTQTHTVNRIQETESQLNHVQSQSQLDHVPSVGKTWESELKTDHGYDGKAAKTQRNRTKKHTPQPYSKTQPNRIQKHNPTVFKNATQPYSKTHPTVFRRA